MRLQAVGRAFPEHRVDQRMVASSLGTSWLQRGCSQEVISRFFDATEVRTRYLAQPLSSYEKGRTFAASNDLFIQLGTHLATEAAIDGLSRARLNPPDVDLLVVVTTTGVAAPSLDARMINMVGFRRDVKRLPVVGLGCVGGTTGLARCMEYVRAAPREVALLVCVELCSLTFQRDDLSTSNLIATALFGDAAAAAVVMGAERAGPGPQMLGSRSFFQPDTEGVLGFVIGDSGFRVMLREDLPEVAGRGLVSEIDRLLAEHRLTRSDVGEWIVHPGGPKILNAIARVLGLEPCRLERSRRCLRSIGNVSSASVLCMLADLIDEPPAPGTYGVVLGMGPGFSAEAVLVQWG